MPKNTLFIVDAYNLIYRMFYAIPEMTNRQGEVVNAIFGVAKFLKSLAEENPEALLVVVTDVGRSFRSTLFSEYKGTRDRMPDNLRSQIDGVFQLFQAAGIPIFSEDGYEADDIIGSIAHQHETNEYQLVIISSDKDLCQFVRDGHVHIYDAMKRKFMKEKDVLEKFGVPAHQVRDYLAIVGDSSDNIPGISGFGPKKAQDLLQKYSTLQGIYSQVGIIDYQYGDIVNIDSSIAGQSDISPKLRESLIQQIENAFLSQKLATIVTDLTIPDLPIIPFAPTLQKSEYTTLLRHYDFRSLLPREEQLPDFQVSPLSSYAVDTLQKLSDLQLHIQQSGQVIIATDDSGRIFLSHDDRVAIVDPQKIDVGDFLGWLTDESQQITLIGYDLKSDLKRIYTIKNPTNIVGNQEQGRLF